MSLPTLAVDSEWLLSSEDLVFANVSELGRAISISGFDTNDLGIEPAFVHLVDVGRLQEHRSILVDVDDGDVHSRTATRERQAEQRQPTTFHTHKYRFA